MEIIKKWYTEEEIGINIKNEKSLHKELKNYVLQNGDLVEVKLDKYIIDIKRGDTLIEIQTKNVYSIKRKLLNLLKNNNVILIHPITCCKNIIKIDKHTNEIVERRKSPKKENIYNVFNELMRVHELILLNNFSLHVYLIDEENIRCDDGKGSYRRKGVSLVDRRLKNVNEVIILNNKEDYIKLLNGLNNFTVKELSLHLGINYKLSGKLCYTYRKCGILKVDKKYGNSYVYALC